MGTPKSIVRGDICMRLSTERDLVSSLMPKKDLQSLVKAFGEVSQNVMDWTFEEARKTNNSPQSHRKYQFKRITYL